MRKIFEHCHLVQNFPRFQRCYRKFNPSPLGYAAFFFFKWSQKIHYQIFFQKRFSRFFEKSLPWILRVPFLHHKTYSPKYWTQSVSPSVRPSDWHSFSQPSPGSELFSSTYSFDICMYIKHLLWNFGKNFKIKSKDFSGSGISLEFLNSSL